MKKVDFNKLQAGDLVEVPRTQFAPMRSGWNGWLFSEAVVIRKGVGRKSKKNILDLNIRTGAGTNYAKTGETTGKGVFTIVEVKAGQGASAGWGRLKSGAGWISLDYATRLA